MALLDVGVELELLGLHALVPLSRPTFGRCPERVGVRVVCDWGDLTAIMQP